MKKKQNGKKNRSIENNDAHSTTKSKLTGNSPKRSKLETPVRDIVRGMGQEEASNS